jgi:branched-subunit amino acid aminotransferase/4-amino-4-deoxychorismate lyase
MPQPLAFFNGEFIPAHQARLPLWDAGFVLGATVTEQLRTFRGQLFHLDHHIRRLRRSLEITGLESPLSWAEFAQMADQLARHNWSLGSSESDLGLAILVTPGPYPTLAPADASPEPAVYMHTYPLPFAHWAAKYANGQALAISSVQQVPQACWPRELKCRSRMHYFLADREVAARFPGARALLTDEHGQVTETATANLLASFDGVSLVTPPRGQILPGVTLAAVEYLAEQLGIPFVERNCTADDLRSAVEIITTSTPSCLLPVTRLDGRPVGAGRPGELYRRLVQAFCDWIRFDFVTQATTLAARG